MAFAGNRFGGLLVGLFVLVGFCVVGSSARALSPPPPPETAEIVFSNGGRILSMNATGANRRVLTGGGNLKRYRPGSDLGDTQPQISPDGTRLLFTRVVQTRKRGQVGSYMVASRDGSDAEMVRRAFPARIYYSTPSWSPDGEEIIFARSETAGRYEKSSIVAVRPEGGERTIAKLKPTKRGENNVPRIFLNPKISPDGKSLLVEISDVLSEIRPRLEIIDLSTGKRRLLAEKASNGDWSPDGLSVVMAVDDRRERPKFCGGECLYPLTDIALIDADGTDRRILFSSFGDETDPEWSGDGTRIAFNSNRNYPTGRYSQEIYTITPEGSCLTWLTNGTPESRYPSWSPSHFGRTDPGQCGDGGRAVSAELAPAPRKKPIPASQIWAGPQVGSMLYSDGDIFGPITNTEYGDCGSYDSRKCGGELFTSSNAQCVLGVFALDLFSERGRYKTESWKGSPYWSFQEGRRYQFNMSMTDSTLVYVMSTKPTSPAVGRQVLRNLKQIGTDRHVRLATRISLPVKAIKRLRTVTRTFKRTGSVSATASKLKLRPATVRRNLRSARVIARFGTPKAMKCPPRSRFYGSSESGGSSTGSSHGSGTAAARALSLRSPIG